MMNQFEQDSEQDSERLNEYLLPETRALQRTRTYPPFVERSDLESGEDSLSTLQQYWSLFRRRIFTLLVAAALGALAALIVSLVLDPVYKAWTTLEVQGINDDFMNMRNVDPTSVPGNSSTGTYLETQIKLIQSQSLIDRTIGKLLAQGRPPLIVSPQDSSAPAVTHRSKASWQDALFMAATNLEVRPSGFTRVVEVKTDSVDPQAAAMFVNTLASEFIQGSLESRWNSSQKTEEWLTRQLQSLKTKLESSERSLQSYARSSGLLFMGAQNVAEEKLRQLQAELSKVQAERVTRQSQYGITLSSPPDALPEMLDQGPLRDYEVRLTDLRRELAELSSSFTPEHYKVKRLQAQISELESAMTRERTNIVRRIRNDYEAALKREGLLSADYSRQSKLVESQSEKAIRYNLLKRESDSNRQLYESLLQRVKESGIASAMQATNIRVVDPALVSLFPYKPRTVLNSLAGLVVGLLIGGVLVFIQERTNRSIQNPGEVSSYLNIRELGFIPAASADPVLQSLEKSSSWFAVPRFIARLTTSRNRSAVSGSVELASWDHKPSLLAESFRGSVASILSANGRKKHPQVIVLTSSRPVEGKTTVVGNLGIAMADINQRVLLIDADLRKPRLHRIFDLPNTWGFSDLLRRDTPIKDVPTRGLVKQTEIPNLCVLPSGPRTVSISNLLYSPRLPELLSRFREEFDTVLIDTPPVIHISDARVLARLSDGVILVVQAHQTDRDTAWMACQCVLADGTPVLGAIINKWDPKKSGENDYYSSYYRYYAASS